jgi:hypothetical protein
MIVIIQHLLVHLMLCYFFKIINRRKKNYHFSSNSSNKNYVFLNEFYRYLIKIITLDFIKLIEKTLLNKNV